MRTLRHLWPVLFFIILTLGAFWARFTPVTIEQTVLDTPQVRRGDFISVSREVTWRRNDCYTINTIAATMTDSLGFRHTLNSKIGMIHFGDKTKREWQVPYTMPWGKSIYQSEVLFNCFPFYSWWPIVVPLPSVIFEVIP